MADSESEDRLETPRAMKEDGANIRIPTLAEVQETWLKWSKRFARGRRKAKQPVEDGELKGASHTTSRLILWFLRLTDEDQRIVQEEGEELLSRLRMLRRKDDRPVIDSRRTESVFAHGRCPASLNPPVVEPPGGTASSSTVKGQKDRSRKGKSICKDGRGPAKDGPA